MMEKDIKAIDVQIHYSFFDDNLHSMNAIIFNDCERQFINAIQSLNKYLDFTIEVEVFAKEDGSLKGLYKIVVKNPLILILITAAITSFFTSSFPQALHHTEETKNKLDNILTIKKAIQTGDLTEEEYDYITKNDKDLNKLKSSYFQAAKKEEKIKQIEIINTQFGTVSCKKKIIIPHDQFDLFIMGDKFEKFEEVIDAKIYIVAPILIDGRRDHWKGILNEESIDFHVTDKHFLEEVHNHNVKFSNGTYINCKLKITRTINLVTYKETLAREVISVINWGDHENYTKPIKKRTYKYQESIQQKLLFDMKQFSSQ